jgi:hypothetical protein
MANTLSSLSLNTNDLSPNRSIRTIRIIGTPGATFSLMIRNSSDVNQLLPSLSGYDANYYFRPVTGAVKGALKKVVLPATGVYSFNQIFPAVSSDNYYDITIKAEENTELGPSIPRNYDTTGIEKETYRVYQYADAGRATFTLTGDTSGTAWFLPFPANVVVTKPTGATTAPVKIHWNIRTDDTITVGRQPRFSNDNPALSDFSGSVDITRSLFDAADQNASIILANDANGNGTANIAAGMIVTGEDIEGKITVESIDDSKTLTLSAPITASGSDTTGVYEEADTDRAPTGAQLHFSSGGATVEFTTFKVSDVYSIATGDTKTYTDPEYFVDFDAEGTITFGKHDFTYTLDLDNFLTLS